MSFSKMGLKTKLFGGFALVLIISLVIGGTGYYSLSKVIKVTDVETLTVEIEMQLEKALVYQEEYIKSGKEEDYAVLEQIVSDINALINRLKKSDSKNRAIAPLQKGQEKYLQVITEFKRLKRNNTTLVQTLQANASRMNEISKAEMLKAEDKIRKDILSSNQKFLKEYSYRSLTNIVDVGLDTIKWYHTSGRTREEALEAIRNLHFEGSNYFYVAQSDHKLVAHGSNRKIEGLYADKLRDKKTNAPFVKWAVDGAIKDGVATVDYYWTKPGMGKAIFPKITVAKYFKPWDLVLLAGVYVDDIENAGQAMNQIVNTGLDSLQDVNRLELLLLNARFNNLYYMYNRTRGEKSAEYLNKLTSLKSATDEIKKAAQNYMESWASYAQNIKHEDEHAEEAVTTTQTAIEMMDKVSSEAKKLFESTTRSGKNIIIVFILAGFLTGIGVTLFLIRSITAPIKQTSLMLKDIAEGEGDLTQRLQVATRDELGELAGWFNTFMDKLQNIIRDIAGNSETLGASSHDLSTLAHEMSKGSEETSGKSNSVAAASEEMSSNMNSVAAASEQSATNVNAMAAATEQMTATIGEIAQNSEKARSITGDAVNKARNASEKVNALGTAASEISNVTETIAEISEQTNLLALNATIEAARAGEAGRGFAVVADEIKELAKQTAASTQEIKEKIDGIQDSTSETVTEIEAITEVIDNVNQVVSTIAAAIEEQSVTTKEIAENAGQASAGIEEVNEKVGESSGVAGEIAREIADVNQTAGAMASVSEQVNNSATELSHLANQLKQMVGTFKI